MMRKLYKYRAYNTNSLGMLINREFYFSDPAHLNDPFDCQIDIRESVEEAVEHAEKTAQYSVKNKILKLINSNKLYAKIEKHIKSCGVLSLAKLDDDFSLKNDALMWSHYSDKHRGFCLGFDLSQKFKKYNMADSLIGISDVIYCDNPIFNPFLDFFVNYGKDEKILLLDEIWKPLFEIGLRSKSLHWKYENEVRVLRAESGLVSFDPTELVEVIFGLRTPQKHEETIRAILKEKEWQHIKYKRVIRKGNGFILEIVDT